MQVPVSVMRKKKREEQALCFSVPRMRMEWSGEWRVENADWTKRNKRKGWFYMEVNVYMEAKVYSEGAMQIQMQCNAAMRQRQRERERVWWCCARLFIGYLQWR